MWAVGIVMMVLLCFGGGFFMHKHGGGKDAQVQTTKDEPRQAHRHGEGLSGDENKGTQRPMMQRGEQDGHGNEMPPDGSGDGKEIAKKSEREDAK